MCTPPAGTSPLEEGLGRTRTARLVRAGFQVSLPFGHGFPEQVPKCATRGARLRPNPTPTMAMPTPIPWLQKKSQAQQNPTSLRAKQIVRTERWAWNTTDVTPLPLPPPLPGFPPHSPSTYSRALGIFANLSPIAPPSLPPTLFYIVSFRPLPLPINARRHQRADNRHCHQYQSPLRGASSLAPFLPCRLSSFLPAPRLLPIRPTRHRS